MDEKLLIAVLGKKNSGKSETWKKLFSDSNIRTAQKSERDLELHSGEFTKVFLINGSPQEREKKVEDIIQVGYDPNIFYLHWLNPGYNDSSEYNDFLGLIPEVMKMNSLVGQRDGKCSASGRVEEIRSYIYNWSNKFGLIKSFKSV